MAFSEFLIWMRRMRCLELGKHWERYQKARELFIYMALHLNMLLHHLLKLLVKHCYYFQTITVLSDLVLTTCRSRPGGNKRWPPGIALHVAD